jgi:hypothetical protein
MDRSLTAEQIVPYYRTGGLLRFWLRFWRIWTAMAAVASLSARAASLDPKQVDQPVCAHIVERERWNSLGP